MVFFISLSSPLIYILIAIEPPNISSNDITPSYSSTRSLIHPLLGDGADSSVHCKMPRKTPGYRLGNASLDPLSTCAKYPSSLWLVPSGPIGLLLDWDVGFARIGIQISRVSSFSFPSLSSSLLFFSFNIFIVIALVLRRRLLDKSFIDERSFVVLRDWHHRGNKTKQNNARFKDLGLYGPYGPRQCECHSLRARSPGRCSSSREARRQDRRLGHRR